MAKYLISGGKTKPDALSVGADFGFEQARLLLYDSGRNKVETLISYVAQDYVMPDVNASNSFRSMSVSSNQLICCTHSEVLIYNLKSFELIKKLSHSYFNDLHHAVIYNDYLYVASTGIDALLVFNNNYELVEYINLVDGYDARERFGDVDFRKIGSTKPHRAHPNFISIYQDRLLINNFQMNSPYEVGYGQLTKIDELTKLHDGLEFENRLWYTRVDGCIVQYDPEQSEVIVFDLKGFENTSKHLGWCRGLHISSIDDMIVGFSRIRPTNQRNNVDWIKNFKKSLRQSFCLPTRICSVDLINNKINWKINLEEHDLNAVFSIHKLD